MTLRKLTGSERGIATIIALMLMIMLVLIGIAAVKLTNDEISIAGNEMNEMAAFYAAEAGLETASASLQSTYEATGAPATAMPAGTVDIGNSVTLVYTTTDNGPATMCNISQGVYSGLNGLVKSYTITSIGTSLIDGSQTRLTQDFECDNIPIFQWAVFYTEELWVEPVFDMNITGRVHCNKDMYVRSSGSGKNFVFEDRVTCAGDIHHGFPWAGSNGDIKFTDAGGNAISMYQDGGWIDSDYNHQYGEYTTWYEASSALWGGEVRDQAYGQEELCLPIGSNDPHKLIERASGNPDSQENKAGLKIIDGTVYSKIGSIWQDVTALLPAGTVTGGASVSFFDAKEKKQIRNTEIDVAKLTSSGYFPGNGIIYISDQTTLNSTYQMNATTLVNGSSLNDCPMTVVCENPIYVQGDFNTINKKPASVICDAVTFLSNSWDPLKALETDNLGRSYSSSTSDAYYAKKIPSKTEVNLCLMTGDTAPDVSSNNHGGGLENFPRFLENWSGTEFKFRGSMIEMWRSREATGEYTYSQYFTAPTRNWGFDFDLEDPSKLPPGTPCIQVFQRTGWQQVDVGYANAGE